MTYSQKPVEVHQSLFRSWKCVNSENRKGTFYVKSFVVWRKRKENKRDLELKNKNLGAYGSSGDSLVHSASEIIPRKGKKISFPESKHLHYLLSIREK